MKNTHACSHAYSIIVTVVGGVTTTYGTNCLHGPDNYMHNCCCDMGDSVTAAKSDSMHFSMLNPCIAK